MAAPPCLVDSLTVITLLYSSDHRVLGECVFLQKDILIKCNVSPSSEFVSSSIPS